MKAFRLSHFTALAFLLACATFGASAADEKVPRTDDVREPPTEFTLTVDGKPVDLREGEPTQVDVGGKPTTMTLEPKPERQFRVDGCSFRFPRRHGFSVEPEDADKSTTWTFDGDESVLIVTRYRNPALKGVDLAEIAADGIAEQFLPQTGEAGLKRSTAKRLIGGKTRDVFRLEITIGGNRIRQEIFSWRAADAGWAMIIQDNLDDAGQITEESQQVARLLERTFADGAPTEKAAPPDPTPEP